MTEVRASPTDYAGNTLILMREAQGTIAENISKSPVPGAKGKQTIFSTSSVGGAGTAKTVLENDAQGNLTTSSSHSLAISGQGGIPVKLADGTVGAGRNGFSQGLNKDNVYVLGDSGNPAAPKIMAFRTDESGNTVRTDGVTALDNLNDLSQLTPVDLSSYLTYSKASTKLTLNTVLNNSQASDASGLAPIQASDVQQNVTFYDAVGGSHTLTITWRKVLSPSDVGANNNAPGAGENQSTRFVTAGGTTHDNCDVWKAIIQYDGANYAQYGGIDFDAANAPRVFIKDGAVVGFAKSGDNRPLAEGGGTETAFPSLSIPFEDAGETFGNVTLDPGFTVGVNGRSSVIAKATDFKSGGSTDGSKFVEMTRWTVDDGGNVQVVYSGGETRTIYKIPVATFNSVNNVLIDKGVWLATDASGAMNMNIAGTGSAGTLNIGKVEESTIDTTQQMLGFLPLSETITAASKIISTTLESQKEILRAFG